MIECLHIAETATYSSTGVILNGLTKFNYFYGPNGSGKTSISRVIADPTQYSKCSVTWKGGNPTERLVYNRDFVERHFRAAAELPGIFTLGEKNAETIEKIEAAKLSCISISNEIITFTKSLQGEDGKGGKPGNWWSPKIHSRTPAGSRSRNSKTGSGLRLLDSSEVRCSRTRCCQRNRATRLK